MYNPATGQFEELSPRTNYGDGYARQDTKNSSKVQTDEVNDAKALTVEYYLGNKEVQPRNSYIDMIKVGSIVQIHSTEWRQGKDMKKIEKITYREEHGDLVVRVHLKNS